MKFIFSFSFILFGLCAFAQISIEEYPRQVKVDVDRVDELKHVEAHSNCDGLQVQMKEQMFSGGCLGTLVRTFVFTDECGNRAEAEQYISLQDEEPPQFQMIEQLETSTGGVPELPQVSATDNSGYDVELVFSETEKDGKLTRLWTATERCGNTNELKREYALGDYKVTSNK